MNRHPDIAGGIARPVAPLAALRALRAPLVVLCALLVLLMAVPIASADGSICVGWAVSDAGDASDHEAADCPFCSAASLGVMPGVALWSPVERMAAVAPSYRPVPRAIRARAPPLGSRAPPHA